MPPTTNDYLQLIDAAGGAPVPSGWTVLVAPDLTTSIGVKTAAFYNSLGQIVIAFQPVGTTALNSATLAADRAIFSGDTPAEFDTAITSYINKVKMAAASVGGTGLTINPDNVFVTGHSLGGYAAEFAAKTGQYGGADFGGPGIPGYDGSAPNPNTFANYIDAGDPVGNYALDTGLDWAPGPNDKLGYHFGIIAPNVGDQKDKTNLQTHISLLTANPGAEDTGGTALAG